MKQTLIRRWARLLGLGLGLLALLALAQSPAKVSALGQYSGYSAPQYQDIARVSQYVTVRDGTRLAVDLFFPATGGQPVQQQMPAVFILERYHKVRRSQDGRFFTEVQMWDFLPLLLAHGYTVVAADSRGTGASFGSRPQGDLGDTEAQDAADLIAWIAAQPWSNGRVGMFGGSYTGITQWLAASQAPPALKAVVPQVAMFDLYSFIYPGGVYNYDFAQQWGQLTTLLDKQVPGAPVDADKDMSQSLAALREHQANQSVKDVTPDLPFRDSTSSLVPVPMYSTVSLTRLLPGVNRSSVAVYSMAGWYDLWPKDHALWFANLTVPQRVLFTPFSHQMGNNLGWYGLVAPLMDERFTVREARALIVTEHLRFYDYHLKGIDNGIMREDPVWYYVMGAPEGQGWRSAKTWPLPEEVRTRFYLGAGKSGSIASVNDGGLSTAAPTAAQARDDYAVDYGTSLGKQTRWQNGVGTDLKYPDLTEQGRRSLTYTTLPLRQDLQITGHPVAHLWVTSTAADGDFFVYLEAVSEQGEPTYLTEGVLRASHRALSSAPYNNLGLPYHRSFQADLQPLPKGQPVELVIDLHPTGVLLKAGQRLRVRVSGADADNFRTPRLEPAPTVSLFREQGHASYVELPLIPAR